MITLKEPKNPRFFEKWDQMFKDTYGYTLIDKDIQFRETFDKALDDLAKHIEKGIIFSGLYKYELDFESLEGLEKTNEYFINLHFILNQETERSKAEMELPELEIEMFANLYHLTLTISGYRWVKEYEQDENYQTFAIMEFDGDDFLKKGFEFVKEFISKKSLSEIKKLLTRNMAEVKRTLLNLIL